MEQLNFDFEIPLGRTCTKCDEWKLMDEFYEHATSRYGREAQCKECRRIHQRQYNTTCPPLSEARREYSRIYAREWRIKHPDYQQQYYEENRDKVNARARRWTAKNPEKVKASRHKHYVTHQEKIKAYRHKYNTENREANRKRWRRYYWTNKEKSIAKSRKWYQEHPDKKRAYKIKYRTRKAGGGGSYTTKEWKDLCERYDDKCLCCGEVKPLTHDHIIPVSKGGSSNISNLQPLCRSCNSKKHIKIIDYR